MSICEWTNLTDIARSSNSPFLIRDLYFAVFFAYLFNLSDVSLTVDSSFEVNFDEVINK